MLNWLSDTMRAYNQFLSSRSAGGFLLSEWGYGGLHNGGRSTCGSELQRGSHYDTPPSGRWSLVKIKLFFHIEIDKCCKVMYYIEKEIFDNKIEINEKANKKD